MEFHSIIRYSILLLTSSLLLVWLPQNLVVVVGATYYTVGDTEGWTYGLNYQSWTQKYNFTVGDALIFSYVKGQHNVYQVVEDTFRSCDARTGVISNFSSGNDVVNLTQATKYWFLCNVKGHCRGGMRFGVTVARASPSPSPDEGEDGGGGGVYPFPTLQTPPPGNGGAAGARVEWWLAVLGMLALVNIV